MRIVYIDLDDTLADFTSAVKEYYPEFEKMTHGQQKACVKTLKGTPRFFENLKLLPGAREAFQSLSQSPHFDVYILSTASWGNPHSWSEKVYWVRTQLADDAYKRLILTHNKSLLLGDYLIDDNPRNGAASFTGEWIQFGSRKFPNWDTVCEYLFKSHGLTAKA